MMEAGNPGSILSAEDLVSFLGADDSPETLGIVSSIRDSAIARLRLSTGTDWTGRGDLGVFNEALRTAVWLSYYAVRDASQNTAFLQEHLTDLICQLQLSGKEAEDV